MYCGTREVSIKAFTLTVALALELFGTVLDSDFEVIALLLETLNHCQVPNLLLDIVIGIFRSLAQQANFTATQETTVLRYVERPLLWHWGLVGRCSTSQRFNRLFTVLSAFQMGMLLEIKLISYSAKLPSHSWRFNVFTPISHPLTTSFTELPNSYWFSGSEWLRLSYRHCLRDLYTRFRGAKLHAVGVMMDLVKPLGVNVPPQVLARIYAALPNLHHSHAMQIALF